MANFWSCPILILIPPNGVSRSVHWLRAAQPVDWEPERYQSIVCEKLLLRNFAVCAKYDLCDEMSSIARANDQPGRRCLMHITLPAGRHAVQRSSKSIQNA